MPSFLFRRPAKETPLSRTVQQCKPHFYAVALFSALFNILALTPTIYMMQIYDRVMGSGSVATLVALSMVCVLALGTMTLLDWLRARLLVRATARFDRELAGETLNALLTRRDLSRLQRSEGMRRFDALRQGLGGPGVVAVLDVPWTPVFLIVACLIHPAIGALSVFGCVVLLALAWSNELATHPRTTAAREASAVSYGNQGHIASYADEIRAMGMREAIIRRQVRDRAKFSELQMDASFAAGNHAGWIKFFRLALQSAALGLGAYLAVNGSISPGSIFAASLLLSRAVAPIEQIVGGWKNLIEVRDAHSFLSALLSQDDKLARTRLPSPTGKLDVENVTVLTPQNDRVALSNISFSVAPGELIGVVGMSGAGKSTLLRVLAGALAPKSGVVRYDSSAYSDWDNDQIARAIGYVPQDFILFPGTVKENISRFDTELDHDPHTLDKAVIEAAQDADVHELIAKLPQGYDTRIGFGGIGLSAGQTQRIALARSLYGKPRILIFDEPNAHLDSESEYRLITLLSDLKKRGVTIIMAAHSGDVLASADRLLVLQAGKIARFGPLRPTISSGAPVPSLAKV